MKPLSIAFVCFVAVAAPASGQDAAATIQALRAESNAAIARHDIEGVVSQYDAVYQGTGGSGGTVQGPAMREVWSAEFGQADDLVYVRTPDMIEVSASGVRAAEIGTWFGSWTTAEGAQRIEGRYAAHWVWVGGEWKLRSELFVTLR